MFDQKYEEWISLNLKEEENPRRRELLEKGLGHGTVEFLRSVWYPAVGNFNYLYPEWEVRDFNNGYGIWTLLICRAVQKAGLKSKGTAPTRETLMSDGLRIYACDTACWPSMDGCFCLSPTYPSKRNRNNASSSSSPSSVNFFRPMCRYRPRWGGRKRKRCVLRAACCVLFPHPNSHSTFDCRIATLAAFCTVWLSCKFCASQERAASAIANINCDSRWARGGNQGGCKGVAYYSLT